jgi:hypothetical protein
MVLVQCLSARETHRCHDDLGGDTKKQVRSHL